MSVQNILDPATGQIARKYINVPALGVVTNPLTASIDGVTAYGLVDANVVSTGTLQTDAISAYSSLPGAPVAVTSNLKLQTPAKQIDFEDTTGANTIASLAQLDINAGGKIVLNAATSVEIPKVGGTAELVMTGNGGSMFVRNDASFAEVVSNEPLRFTGEAINPTAVTAYLDTGSLTVRNGQDTPNVRCLTSGNVNCAMSATLPINSATVTANSGTSTAYIATDGTTQRLRLAGASGTKYGDVITSETGNYVVVQAEGGLNLTMESTGGSVNIATALADRNIDITANGGSATMTISDVGGNGYINMMATDSGTGTTNSLLIDPTAQLITGTAFNGFTVNGCLITAFNGAVEGVEMGFDTNQNKNIVAGFGLDMEIKQFRTDPKYIKLANSAGDKVQINVDVGEFELLGANILSGTSGGSSGQHLVITVNGTPYKIKLENP